MAGRPGRKGRWRLLQLGDPLGVDRTPAAVSPGGDIGHLDQVGLMHDDRGDDTGLGHGLFRSHCCAKGPEPERTGPEPERNARAGARKDSDEAPAEGAGTNSTE